MSSFMVHERIHWTCNLEVCYLMYGDFLSSPYFVL
jgi:hypothetical protein